MSAAWGCTSCGKEVCFSGTTQVEGEECLKTLGWKNEGAGYVCPHCQALSAEQRHFCMLERRIIEIEKYIGMKPTNQGEES